MLRLTDNRRALVTEFTEVTDNPRVHSGHSIIYSLNKLLISFFVVTFLRRINLAKEKEKRIAKKKEYKNGRKQEPFELMVCGSALASAREHGNT